MSRVKYSEEPQTLDFAEGSCWGIGGFRSTRIEACFILRSYSKIQGQKLSGEIRIDYGIFFDPDNHYLQSVLSSHFPTVDWSEFVFHRSLDRSRIFITPWYDTKEVGEIVLRGSSRNRKKHDQEWLRSQGITLIADRRV